MTGRKKGPQVAARSSRQRLIELGKDVLIVALTCSAVYLAGLTPMMTQLRSWMAPPAPTAQAQPRQARDSVTPYSVAVRNSLGLYGVSYDQTTVERVFSQLSPLIGEALTAASAPESITPAQWQGLLDSEGLYCKFQGEVPLEALAAWLGEGSALTGGAETVVLGRDGESVWLGWQAGDAYYRAPTGLSYPDRVRDTLEDFGPNGAAFAYALRETDNTYDTLDPYVLVTATTQRPMTYAASSPDLMGDADALGTLLEVLGFRSGAGSAYEAAGELAINENGDRLRINTAGRVVFHAGEEERYPVSCVGETAAAQEAALAAWELLNRAVEPWKGESVYVLTGVEAAEKGWQVTFQPRLDGIPVHAGESGWCAQFTVEGRKITDFTLDLRSYISAGTTSLVTSERLAAAALKSQESSGQLKLRYTDNGSAAVTAGWVAEE